MYEFVTHTFNIIKGNCDFDCVYCYMKKWKKVIPPRFDAEELKTDLLKDLFIFFGSSIDVFAPNINREWIYKSLEFLNKFDNSYLLQSKAPRLMERFKNEFPPKTVLCTTIETNRHYTSIMMNAPPPIERVTKSVDYVTIEPIMQFDLKEIVSMIREIEPIQVNIGADSMGKKLPEPSSKEIIDLVDSLSEFTKVVKKRNLNRLLK